MSIEKDYISLLEDENARLRDKIEILSRKTEWEEKTKDLRTLGAEYKKMDEEVYSVNKDKILNDFLSLDTASIISMLEHGYRISTSQEPVSDPCFIPKIRHAVNIAGPYVQGIISYNSETFFAVSLSVRRSRFYPLISDSCFLTFEHNRVCNFSGAIAESCHMIDSKHGNTIIELLSRVNMCKKIMNGKLLCMDEDKDGHPVNCRVSRDTFKYPWTDLKGFDPD
jgi:hypothetical protein